MKTKKLIPFALDRLKPVPKFYVPKPGTKFADHKLRPDIILAETAAHPQTGWVYVGIVSEHTPYGQGICIAIKFEDLREASDGDILKALLMPHPHDDFYAGKFMPPNVGNAIEAKKFGQIITDWRLTISKQINQIVVSHGWQAKKEKS